MVAALRAADLPHETAVTAATSNDDFSVQLEDFRHILYKIFFDKGL